LSEVVASGFSPAYHRLREAATVGATRRANELKQSGHDILVISGGQPDFDTPLHIKQAAVEAIAGGYTKYTPTDGSPELKAAIIAKMARDYGLKVEKNQVVVGTGGKQVIFNALFATVADDDEVIIPCPYYPSYSDIVDLLGARPIYADTRSANNYKLTAEELESRITAKTRWFVLNSPSNPTGAVYSASELGALAQILMKYPRVAILSDDIYEHIVFGEASFTSILAVEPRLAERTLIVNGVSKGHCMTGWRIGYGVGPADLIQAMARLQGQQTNGACSISQAAAVAALTGPMDFIASHNAAYQRRRDLVIGEINTIEGLSCTIPEGAIYVYVDASEIIGSRAASGKMLMDDLDVAEHLLEAGGVAVVPGAGFGLSPCFRLCFAYSDEQMVEACARIRGAIEQGIV
jgi:aspartate aminotransferase